MIKLSYSTFGVRQNWISVLIIYHTKASHLTEKGINESHLGDEIVLSCSSRIK